ncbi:MAG: cell division protein SepF, partial [Clostridia bacterium]|nr:cell division protein SepF [Clostridia bacterium]
TYSTRSGYRSGSAYGYAGERRSPASAYRAGETQPRYRATAARSAAASAPQSEPAGAFEASPAAGYQRHQTIIFRLRSVDECKDVILSLIDRKSVLMSLEALDSVQAQRALDTMSGAAYAIGAALSRASDKTWLITPSNVEVERSSLDEDGYGGYN